MGAHIISLTFLTNAQVRSNLTSFVANERHPKGKQYQKSATSNLSLTWSQSLHWQTLLDMNLYQPLEVSLRDFFYANILRN